MPASDDPTAIAIQGTNAMKLEALMLRPYTDEKNDGIHDKKMK